MKMRMDSFVFRSGRVVPAFALISLLGLAACNEADGTAPWPGAYPPESEINRPKGGDAGKPPDGGAVDGGAHDGAVGSDTGVLDAGANDAGALDAGSDAALDAGELDAGSDAALDAGNGDGAAPDASGTDAAMRD
jgi:hypothetical protein